ncbi:MAG: hypothetical protein C0423_19140 [Methylibium sp.]|nr:hypothetical protein [Methylibium sp.]
MKKSPKFSPEVRKRAVCMMLERRHEHPSQRAAVESIAGKIGCMPQTQHTWVHQHEFDAGQRESVSTAEAQDIKELKRENRELRKVNEIQNSLLPCAAVLFPGSPGVGQPLPFNVQT